MILKKHLISILLVLVIASIACIATSQTQTGITVPTPVSPGGSVEISQPTAEAQPLPTTTPVTITTQMNAQFVVNNSGSLCPKRVPDLILGSPSIIGEIDDTWRCEGYWTFDISGLPAQATILSATFQPGTCSVVGNPFSLDKMKLGAIDVGTLEVSDYGGPPQDPTHHTNCPGSIDVVSIVKSNYNLGLTTLQIYAAFDLSDYGNGTGDYVSYQGSTPLLTIEYSYLQNK